MTVQLYCLRCPITNLIRYIGYTTLELEKRLRFHINSSKSNDKHTHRGKWILKLLSKGVRPLIEHLVTYDTVEQAKKVEVLLIKHYKQFCKLVNGTDGGDGRTGHKVSEEGRRRMTEYRTGRPNPAKRIPITLIHEKTGERVDLKDKWDAASYLNCSPESIVGVLYGTRNSVNNHYCINTNTIGL